MVWAEPHMKANRESSQITATVATAEYRITSEPKNFWKAPVDTNSPKKHTKRTEYPQYLQKVFQ